MSRHKILFLAANPIGTKRLALDREAKAIEVALEQGGHRGRFRLVTRWAVQPLELLTELRKLKPTIVHFSGHGGQRMPGDQSRQSTVCRDITSSLGPPDDEEGDGLFFEGPDGRAQLVTADALQRAFGAAGASVRLVVLNACYSEVHAEALLAHVDCVVGMSGAIDDDAARAYAIGFYGGLGDRESVAAAHRQGCAAISLEGLRDVDRPQLKVRAGIDADRLIIAPNPPPRGAETVAMDASKRAYFRVARGFAIFTLGIAAWAFGLGTLTADQRTMVRILLPITCGFVAGGFAGARSDKTSRWIPGAAATATGGLGIWLLISLLWPEPERALSVVVRPHGPNGLLDMVCHDGRVLLDLGGDRRPEDITTKGEARFDGIPSSLTGSKVVVSATCNGFRMEPPSVTLELRSGIPIYVPMVPTSEEPVPAIQQPRPEIVKDEIAPRDIHPPAELGRDSRDKNVPRAGASPSTEAICNRVRREIHDQYPDLTTECENGDECQIVLRFPETLRTEAENARTDYNDSCKILITNRKTDPSSGSWRRR